MVTAMDRRKSTPGRRSWMKLGLGLAVCASQLGCSQLKQLVNGNAKPSAEIGQVTDSGGGYYQGQRPPFETAPQEPTPGPLDTMPPALAQVRPNDGGA